MSNVHGLYSDKKDDEEDDHDDSNNRYVGGIGDHGGGSGLAVEPNNNADDDAAATGAGGAPPRDSIFGLAQEAGNLNDGEQIRRTITMYRDGFTVDDGPYRRLDDPNNAPFLRALAMGRTPRELEEEAAAETGSTNVVVGLVDKRNEDYVETFTSFSGTGTSLGTSTTNSAATGTDNGVFDPSTLPETPPAPTNNNTTSIAVRLLNGKRQIVKLSLDQTVADLAAHLREHADNNEPFRLVSGFPPQPLSDVNMSIQDAGLKGAQVSMQKA